MRFARWISKATNAHSEYVTLIAFSLQQWLRERASILRYTYIAWLFTFPVIFFLFSNQQSEYWVLYELMCWLSLVVRFPPARRSLSWIQLTVDWCMAPRKWGFDLKSNSTNYPDHGHHGDPPPTRKIPIIETGIETGSSWFVARSSEH